MKNSLLDIAHSYFDDKKAKNFNPDNYYIDKIKSMGFDDDLSKDIFLKIDDEWTLEEHNLLLESKMKMMKITGITAFCIGLFLTIYSFFFVNSFTIYFYGLILGGILTYYYSGNLKAEVNKNRTVRQSELNRIERKYLNNQLEDNE